MEIDPNKLSIEDLSKLQRALGLPEIPTTPWLSSRVEILMGEARQAVRDNEQVRKLNRVIWAPAEAFLPGDFTFSLSD